MGLERVRRDLEEQVIFQQRLERWVSFPGCPGGDGCSSQAEGVVWDVQRPIMPRCSLVVGKNTILPTRKRSERLERWGPDYQGPVCSGKVVDFTLE